MHTSKFFARVFEFTALEIDNGSSTEQGYSLRLGRFELSVSVERFHEPLPLDQCRRGIDFTGPYTGSQVTLFRRWYIVGGVGRVSPQEIAERLCERAEFQHASARAQLGDLYAAQYGQRFGF